MTEEFRRITIDRFQVPWVAVLATSVISGLCFGASYIGAGKLWSWLQSPEPGPPSGTAEKQGRYKSTRAGSRRRQYSAARTRIRMVPSLLLGLILSLFLFRDGSASVRISRRSTLYIRLPNKLSVLDQLPSQEHENHDRNLNIKRDKVDLFEDGPL
jgi:hypothetical protein